VWLFTLGTPVAAVTINHHCVSNRRDMSYYKRFLGHDAVSLQSIWIRLDCDLQKQNQVSWLFRDATSSGEDTASHKCVSPICFTRSVIVHTHVLGLSSLPQELPSYTLRPRIWRESECYQSCNSFVVIRLGIEPSTYTSASGLLPLILVTSVRVVELYHPLLLLKLYSPLLGENIFKVNYTTVICCI
jgi:hypothetical protein